MESLTNYLEETKLGVTVFKFEFPGSEDQFIAAVRSWMTSTVEGNRYEVREPSRGMFLKIQRGMGVLTAPIIIEFEIGSVLGLSTEVLARGYVKMFALKRFKQDLRSDAVSGALPRRNGWKDMVKLLEHLQVSYDNWFEK